MKTAGRPVRRGKLLSLAYRTLGMAALTLALVGVVLPGLPTTPFLLVAAWAFGRGAPHLAARLEQHRSLGPLLRNWRDRRVIPKRAKALAAGSMALSFAILWASATHPAILAGVGITLLVVATYLLSRPSS